jgi:RNA ligase (TIGR02306 family)
MSEFSVPVVRIRSIEPIPKADALELAVIGDYRSAVRKGQFKAGDLAVYLPEAAVLPEWLLRKLGLWDEAAGRGLLDGTDGNRIKARTLRGALSQGIVLPVDYRTDATGLALGVDGPDGIIRFGDAGAPVGSSVAGYLGVGKYVPEIPDCLKGDACEIFGHTARFEVEDIKRYPDVMIEGEMVAVTEKIHGVQVVLGCVPGLQRPQLFLGGDVYVASKDLARQGIVFMDTQCNRDRNVHVKAFLANLPAVKALAAEAYGIGQPIHVIAEAFGAGVQDLAYGLAGIGLRGLQVYVGHYERGRWLGLEERQALLARIGLEMAPLVYRGPFSQAVLAGLCAGKTVVGNGAHIREGAVVEPVEPRRHNTLGRVILKSVSAAYLTRKGGTEFN